MVGSPLFRYLALTSLAVCYVTILLGGTVMARGDGLSCPQWPACTPTLWPAWTGGIIDEFAHRLLALLLSGLLLALAVVGGLAERRRPILQRMVYLSLVIVVLQSLLGGAVVLYGLSTLLVVLHLTLATLLFGLLSLLSLLTVIRDIPPRWISWARQAINEGRSGEADSTSSPQDPRLPISPSLEACQEEVAFETVNQ